MAKRHDTKFLVQYFDDMNAITRDDLLGLLTSYRPVGSGSLGIQTLLCRLLVHIVSLKGFEPITLADVEAKQKFRILENEERDWLKQSVSDLVGYSRISAKAARDRMQETAANAPSTSIGSEFIKIAEAIIEQTTTDTPALG